MFGPDKCIIRWEDVFSPNPKTDPGVTEDNMIQLDFSSLFFFLLHLDDLHGIKAIVLSGAGVDVKVYAYNSDAFDGRGSWYTASTASQPAATIPVCQILSWPRHLGIATNPAFTMLIPFFPGTFSGDDIKGMHTKGKVILAWKKNVFDTA